jgi:hypothetical protein
MSPDSAPAEGEVDWFTLIVPVGAELAPISHGSVGYEAYREHAHGGRWLVDVPREVAFQLLRAGFKIFGRTG